MQFIDGYNISSDFIYKNIQLHGQAFWSVAKQLLDIIKYLHKNGIKHNDIHGGNIMITSDKKIYLIDCKTELILSS